MLGRKVLDIVNVILENDSAIIGGDYDAYREDNFDEKHLVLSDEIPPTRFKIKQLNEEQKEHVHGQTGVRKQADMAIRCALVGIENYILDMPGGKSKKIDSVKIVNDMVIGKSVCNKWLRDELGLLTEQRLNLYLAIDRISEAQPPLSMLSAAPAGPTLAKK